MSTIDEQIDTLTNLSIKGQIHIALQEVLSKFLDREEHRAVLSEMEFETFLTRTREAHFWTAFVCFSKLYDSHKDAVSIYKLSKSAESNASKFKYADKDDVLYRIKLLNDLLDLHSDEIEKLKKQRDNFLAHIDPKVSKMTPDERRINIDAMATLFKSAVSFLDDLFQYWNGGRRGRERANLFYSNENSAITLMSCLLNRNASNKYEI